VQRFVQRNGREMECSGRVAVLNSDRGGPTPSICLLTTADTANGAAGVSPVSTWISESAAPKKSGPSLIDY
jgi:hypothetical protein